VLSYKNLEGQQKLWRSPSNVLESLGTGTRWIAQDKDGAIILGYEDGTEERRLVADPPEIGSFTNYLSLVTWVQEARA
jgi:hypothetical protein